MNKHFLRMIVTISFFVSVLLSIHVHAEQLNVNIWTFDVEAKRVSENLPVYLRAKDSKESGAITAIPKSPFIKGLSSIAFAKSEKGQVLGFLAGTLSSPGNRLVVVEILIHNTAKQQNSFLVSDFYLLSPDGKKLPYAAIAIGDSYLVAKSSMEALTSSQEKTATVEPDQKIKVTYCFIIPSKNFPATL